MPKRLGQAKGKDIFGYVKGWLPSDLFFYRLNFISIRFFKELAEMSFVLNTTPGPRATEILSEFSNRVFRYLLLEDTKNPISFTEEQAQSLIGNHGLRVDATLSIKKEYLDSILTGLSRDWHKTIASETNFATYSYRPDKARYGKKIVSSLREVLSTILSSVRDELIPSMLLVVGGVYLEEGSVYTSVHLGDRLKLQVPDLSTKNTNQSGFSLSPLPKIWEFFEKHSPTINATEPSKSREVYFHFWPRLYFSRDWLKDVIQYLFRNSPSLLDQIFLEVKPQTGSGKGWEWSFTITLPNEANPPSLEPYLLVVSHGVRDSIHRNWHPPQTVSPKSFDLYFHSTAKFILSDPGVPKVMSPRVFITQERSTKFSVGENVFEAMVSYRKEKFREMLRFYREHFEPMLIHRLALIAITKVGELLGGKSDRLLPPLCLSGKRYPLLELLMKDLGYPEVVSVLGKPVSLSLLLNLLVRFLYEIEYEAQHWDIPPDKVLSLLQRSAEVARDWLLLVDHLNSLATRSGFSETGVSAISTDFPNILDSSTPRLSTSVDGELLIEDENLRGRSRFSETLPVYWYSLSVYGI